MANNADLHSLFKSFDTNGDGFLSPSEMHSKLTDYGFTESSIDAMFCRMDLDGDGQIDFAEFEQTYRLQFFPKMPTEAKVAMLLVNEYKIHKILGTGAFSSVLLAENIKTKERLAAKLTDMTGQKRDMPDQLRGEVAILERCQHPNIIRIVQLPPLPTEKEGTCIRFQHDFCLMLLEVVEGGELFDRLERFGRFTETQAASLFLDCASAVKYMHDRGIAHLDIKPENILFTSDRDDGQLKLTDFGFARDFSGLQKTTKVFAGTPGYMAPEVYKEQSYSLEPDIFSLGVVLYVMLCGFFPFEDQEIDELRYTTFDYPSPEWDDVSPSAKALISAMMQVDPRARPTIDDVLAHEWLRNTPPNHVHEAVLENIRKFRARRRMKKGIAAVRAVRRLSSGLGLKKMLSGI